MKRLVAPHPARSSPFSSAQELEHADDGGADSDDSPPGSAGPLDLGDGVARQRVSLLVHGVILDSFGPDRRKRREPDIEAERRPPDAGGLQPLDHRTR